MKYFYNKKKQVVGQFADGTYITKRTPKKHYYFKGKGYPISEDILNELVILECKDIVSQSKARKKTMINP